MKEKSLIIAAKGQKILSKTQQQFNKLTKQIETLERDIVCENEKLTKLLELHSKEISPILTKAANLRIQLAMSLDKAAKVYNFNKKQTENTRQAILLLCNDAFMQIEPNPEQEAFYDQWSEVSYKEEMKEQVNESKEMFSDYMSDMFGFDVKMEDMGDSPEDFARLQQKLKEQFEQSQQNSHKQTHKKTNKQLKKEEAQKAEEKIKHKSIRSIYIALAKVLHPDVEIDESRKLEKEEIMKKVTVAYDQKDLPTLLKLEMEWVHKTTEHLEELTDDKLKIYISVLKQQVADLESERFGLYHDPRYAEISSFAHLAENYAVMQIKKQKKEFKSIINEFDTLIATFGRPNAKTQINQFVIEFCRENEQDEFDMFWDEPFYGRKF